MSTHHALPPRDVLKDQARRLRKTLETSSQPVSHGRALELIAGQYGYRDWNTLSASAPADRARPPVQVGDTVRGTYLGQHFTGAVRGLQALSDDRHYRATIVFDRPVDVVTFDSFSALRHRVTLTIDERGRTRERTSNGRPHLELAL
ncbi:glyoxalase superfamily protein [Pararhizobium haloflavum]|uniref:glyoxalase superfamily protein n=1 Tax=Pararhizobium haloflavum TaxID=2037914 RepID=UPI000C18D28D|nr:glyoxalase superfamily protein [Pararhizobium haloflavum]